ncbi:hypothetical protein IV500_05090 [Paeniglutamicibacter antarcticus]|uniref:Uncharacterized protein n=1 Tax=Arthrobacter terrae TaxID=2935737 RepID=A0A931G710_9MICC|nr:hypothetical protein [Arthrobacter terrae]MBG0738794.1 hypothetical protein [Arthrobacter terrae]
MKIQTNPDLDDTDSIGLHKALEALCTLSENQAGRRGDTASVNVADLRVILAANPDNAKTEIQWGAVFTDGDAVIAKSFADAVLYTKFSCYAASRQKITVPESVVYTPWVAAL